MKEYSLVVDIGNSNITLGLFADQAGQCELLHSFRLVTQHFTTTDEMGLKMHHLFQHHQVNPNQVKRAAFISVVPALNRNITKSIKQYFGIDIVEIRHKMFEDFHIDYDREENLGIDRLTNLKAASVLVGLPAVVVDFGTATTVDVVNQKKKYLGGMIIPGVLISLEMLTQRASKLPNVELCEPKQLLGKSTKENLQNGSYFLTSYGIDGIIESIASEYFHGCPFDIIFTGGLASFITKKSKWKSHLQPSLTLSGIKILLDEVKSV